MTADDEPVAPCDLCGRRDAHEHPPEEFFAGLGDCVDGSHQWCSHDA